MTKKELRHKAQDELLSALGVAFARLNDEVEHEITTRADADLLRAEMSKQMARVEKLFGVDPGSSYRGV